MTGATRKSFVQVEVIPARAEESPILANLLQLYAHDFSEFHDVELGPDGKFTYNPLPLYWSDPRRRPFLVWVEGKLAGFVLTKRGSVISGDLKVWDLAEFFVLRAFRRRGVGTRAARQLWRQLPGLWEVRVMQANVSAQYFWARAIYAFTGMTIEPERVEIDGELWKVFSFCVAGSSERSSEEGSSA